MRERGAEIRASARERKLYRSLPYPGMHVERALVTRALLALIEGVQNGEPVKDLRLLIEPCALLPVVMYIHCQ